MNVNVNNSNDDNVKSRLVENSSIGPTLLVLWPFLNSASKFKYMSLCKSIRENVINKVNFERFKQIQEVVKQCEKVGLFFGFFFKDVVSPVLISISSTETIIGKYGNRIRLLSFLEKKEFIDNESFLKAKEFVDSEYVDLFKSSETYADASLALDKKLLGILRKDKSLFFKSLRYLRNFVDIINKDNNMQKR